MLFQVVLLMACAAMAAADHGGHGHGHGHRSNSLVQRPRSSRQESGAVTGGVDFSGCQTDPDTGFCCVEKEETVTSLQKDPILECTHKNVEKCHYTYVTQFDPAQEEVCEENFEKTCQVTFKQQAFNETVKKCYKPMEKVCNGQGPEECRTVYESSCTTRYVEKQPGKFVGDTSCEKLPVEICGAGCSTQEGAEECHEKVITSLLDVPEEVCDLNPQKTCRFVTRLVPKLAPKHECTTIPQETCNLKFSAPQVVDKPLKTKWCLDPTPAAPDSTYEDSPDLPPVVTEPPQIFDDSQPQAELPAYGNRPPPPPPPPRPSPPPTLYNAGDIRTGRNDDFFTVVGAAPQADFVQPVQVNSRRQGRRNGRRFGRRNRNGRRRQRQRSNN